MPPLRSCLLLAHTGGEARGQDAVAQAADTVHSCRRVRVLHVTCRIFCNQCYYKLRTAKFNVHYQVFSRARACAREHIPVCPPTRVRVRVLVRPCITFRCSNTAGNCDPSCQPEGVIVNVWLVYTPELQLTIVLLSSPVTLLVALWGMTSSQARSMMKIGGSGGGGAAKKLHDRILQPAHDGNMTMQAALRPGIDVDTD